jgi:hypothetical protein
VVPARFLKGKNMYGSATMGYGVDIVRSCDSLNGALKRRQVLHPESRFALRISGLECRVSLLSNGFIEWDGEMPSIATEKRLDDILKNHGGILFERR